MPSRQSLLFVFAVILSCIFGWGGRDIAFASQWPFYDALRTTASIVLAVMGAWLTLLYPKALESVLNRSETPSSSDHEDRIAALMLPVKLSTAVVAAVLMLGPFALLLKQISWTAEQLSVLRGVSFALLVFLTLAEMGAVLLTLWPIDAAKGELKSVRQKQSQRASLFKLVQRR